MEGRFNSYMGDGEGRLPLTSGIRGGRAMTWELDGKSLPLV